MMNITDVDVRLAMMIFLPVVSIAGAYGTVKAAVRQLRVDMQKHEVKITALETVVHKGDKDLGIVLKEIEYIREMFIEGKRSRISAQEKHEVRFDNLDKKLDAILKNGAK